MKQLLVVFLLVLFTGSSALAQTSGEPLSLTLKAGVLKLNREQISGNWKVAPLVKLLGSPRLRDGYNTTHSYDNVGIVLFERSLDSKPTNQLSEIQFYLSAGTTNSVSPTGFYTGKITMENKEISEYVSLRELREILKGYAETNSYTAHSFRFAKDGIYMYVQYEDTDRQIQKISLGKDK